MRAWAVDCRSAVTLVWACAAIAAAVLATMIYSLIAFYRSASTCAAARTTGLSAQIVWSLIPIGIFLGVAVPVIKALLFTGDHCNW